MNDNVIILGAGASFDAGVPLSSGFIEKMREYAFKSKTNEGPLSDEDIEIFESARKVMGDLYDYHGSANFDDRNLEDILSVLSFSIIGRRQKEKDPLNIMIKAIARTIELSCKVKHNGVLNQIHPNEPIPIYRTFWEAIFNRFTDYPNIPTIISFNYDLVMERALFQLLIRLGKPPFTNDGIILRYHYKASKDFCYQVERTHYTVQHEEGFPTNERGTHLKLCTEDVLKKPMEIKILKLHGSLNFPRRKYVGTTPSTPPTNPVDNPFIMPPISNKSISYEAEDIWKEALDDLRGAKNIVIVGYSLPATDIYVQYFLKTALGPNKDLTKITIFNPDLTKETGVSLQMRNRYAECLSQQVIKRIINFDPESTAPIIGDEIAEMGKFTHFVREINQSNSTLFF